jgi:outer membrane autotransporter protein
VGENDADVGQFRLGAEVSYLAGAFEPYIGGIYSYDFTRTDLRFAAGVPAPKSDNDDFQVNLGLRYFGDNGLSGTLEYSRLLGRANYDEGSFSANLRWNF